MERLRHTLGGQVQEEVGVEQGVILVGLEVLGIMLGMVQEGQEILVEGVQGVGQPERVAY